jgi:CheY-like chemotaxis protein
MYNGKGKFLVIEDEEGIRELIVNIGKGQGYEVKGFPSPHELFENINDFSEYDGIFTDFNMPQMNGKDAAEKLIKEFNYSRARIIPMSGYDYDTAREEFSELGINVILQKPFEMKIITDLMKVLEPKYPDTC